jgi:hypothetical protein
MAESGECFFGGEDRGRDRADAARYPFLALTVRVDRGDGWSRPVTAYAARQSGRVVALER